MHLGLSVCIYEQLVSSLELHLHYHSEVSVFSTFGLDRFILKVVQVQEPWACPDTWMMLRENGDMATLTEKITIDQFGFKILSQTTSLPMNYFRLTTGLNSAKHQSFPCNLMKELMIAERVDMQKQGVCEMDCLGQGDLIVLQSARER